MKVCSNKHFEDFNMTDETTLEKAATAAGITSNQLREALSFLVKAPLSQQVRSFGAFYFIQGVGAAGFHEMRMAKITLEAMLGVIIREFDETKEIEAMRKSKP